MVAGPTAVPVPLKSAWFGNVFQNFAEKNSEEQMNRLTTDPIKRTWKELLKRNHRHAA